MVPKFDLTILEKCLFYFFKIFGLASMKFEISTINKRRLFANSKIGIAYNSFLVFLICIFNIILIGYKIENISSLPNIRGVQKITDVVQVGFATFTCIFILLYFCVRQKKTITIANQICQIYDSFSINNYEMDKKNKRKVFLIITLLMFCTNFIFWISMIVTSVNFNMATLNEIIFYYPAVYSSHMIMQSLLMQYSITLHVIGFFFKYLNKSLIILLKKPDQLFLEAQYLNIDKIKSERVSQMRKSYLILGKISKDISTFYSPPMFFCISVTFVTVIRAGLYLAVSITDENSNLPIRGLIHCIVYITHYFFLLVMLTKMVSKIITEVSIYFNTDLILLR